VKEDLHPKKQEKAAGSTVSVFRIRDSHSGGYEDFYLLGYKAVDFERTTRHYIPENRTLQTQYRLTF
jgi:hypothetical protein